MLILGLSLLVIAMTDYILSLLMNIIGFKFVSGCYASLYFKLLTMLIFNTLGGE